MKKSIKALLFVTIKNIYSIKIDIFQKSRYFLMIFVPKLNNYFNTSNVHVLCLFVIQGIIELMSQTVRVVRLHYNSYLFYSNAWRK